MQNYYHASNDLLEMGTLLEPRYGRIILDPRYYSYSDHNHNQYLREMTFEEYRLAHFPNKPSRLNSVFLFDNIKLAEQYQYKFSKKYIYKVEVATESKVLKADMTYIDLTVRKSIQEIRQLASYFFNEDSTNTQNIEILCEGKVKIIKRI